MTPSDVEQVERVIPAPAEKIFALLADPHAHPRIDGSGTVRDARTRKDRLELGSRFGMAMRMGLPYSMINTVVEFEENRRIAWKTHATGFMERFIGGRVWRYELEPVDGGTLVRETWDASAEVGVSKAVVVRMGPKARQSMTATLRRIETLLAD